MTDSENTSLHRSLEYGGDLNKPHEEEVSEEGISSFSRFGS